MKKLSETIGKIVFYLFVLAVAAWTASLTLSEMKAILPNDPLTPYFALALFDGGALAWLMAWLGHARGLMQRSISVIMLVLDLAGIVLLSAGRLLDGGQTLIDIPPALAQAVIYGVIGATLANLAAIYIFHITDPETMEEIETSILEDTLQAEAMKQAQANIESQAQQLGAILAARATGKLKYRLNLPMGENESAAVIDVKSEDITTSPAPQKHAKVNPLARWIMTAARKMKRTNQPAAAIVYEQTAPAPAPEVIETADPTMPAAGQPNQTKEK